VIEVGIVGGTGYTGAELLRLLVRHPQVALRAITSRGEAGTRVDVMFPSLRGHTDLSFVAPEQAQLQRCDVVFFATPHGVAMQQAPALLAAGVRIVDLAADFRLRDPGEFRRWYRMEHACEDLVAQAVYGLPELGRAALRGARLVANPGCYPTAVLLGFAPLLREGLVDPSMLIANCASGASGSGRRAELRLALAETGESFHAYALDGHRHGAEIDQQLRVIGPQGNAHCLFVPHLLPIVRGIHSTLYARLTPAGQRADLQRAFETFYSGERFVDVMPAGSAPATRSVRASNVARIAVHRPQPDTAVVLVVLDNLVKGAAGQAVQCMNLMFGIDEGSGLEQVAVMP
jgi:N-acetyl-gamma-glutamyl-phosphate reductase